MAYQTLASYNLSGLFGLVSYADIISGGIFVPFLLAFVWAVFTFSSYFIQKNAVGTGDFAQSLAVGGFFLGVSSIFLRIIDTGMSGYRLVDGVTLSVCLVVSGISVLFFLFSRDN